MQRFARQIAVSVCGVLSLVLVSCGSSSGGTLTAAIKLSSSITARTALEKMEALQLGNFGIRPFAAEGLRGTMTAGGASATQLTSLKYFFTSIQICQSMTTSGTAFNNPTGCLTVYQGPTDATLNPTTGGGTPDYAAQASYAASTTTGFVDLMTSAGRATIAAGGTITPPSATAGTYNWGLVNWAYPIKTTATISAGGTTLTTQAGPTANVSGSGLTTASTPFTSATPAEATVTLPNGGTWIRFQSPFVVNAGDPAISVALAFNPDNLIRGFAANGASTTPTNLSFYDGATKSTSNAINVPFLDMTPVPLKGSDQAVVESYLSTSTSGMTDTFAIRLELYYNSNDAAKSIYGATLRVIPASNSTYSTDIAKIANISAGATSGTLNFNDYASAPIVAGFTRQSTVGQTTTATLPCSGGANAASNTFSPAGCGSGGTVTATFTLQSVGTLN